TLADLARWSFVMPAGASPPDYLTRGMNDAAVHRLQLMLDRLTLVQRTEDLNPGPADGNFGEGTEKDVPAFQQQRWLTGDGAAGPGTGGALEAALREAGITALALRGATLPRLGIICSHPGMLAAGRDGEIESFNALAVRTGCRPVLIPPCADVVLSGDREA